MGQRPKERLRNNQEALVLGIYDPQLEAKVIADASSYGIGAVMI